MIGQTISHYKILEKLGEGGMGIVYKAQDITLDRTVALKFLPPRAVVTDDDRARFANEARAAAKLSHPHIAIVYEFGEAEDQTFLAMELINGKSLRKKTQQGPLPVGEVLRVASEAGNGLAAAHEHGIIHRDVKSENIMLTPDGSAKIMDFGLALVRGQSRLWKSGETVGTVSYMSPEQARGEHLDERTDIWSLGVVMYEMLTGKLPFPGEYESAVLYLIIHEQPQPIKTFRDDVPTKLQEIVSKCLEKEAERRYQKATELLAEVNALQKQLERGIEDRQEKPVEEKRFETERRPVTVLHASLVSSGTEGLDPEALTAGLDECIDGLIGIIEKYDGMADRVVGDKLMAVFGAPIAHENDPERAIRCAHEMISYVLRVTALGMSQASAALHLKIGIHTGVVIAGNVGAAGKSGYSVVGDAINVAAGIVDVVPTGKISLSADAYKLVSGMVEVEEPRMITMRGKTQELKVFDLRSLKLGAEPGRRQVGGGAFVGRIEELKLFEEAIERVQDNAEVRLFIRGEAGVGKTRLKNEMVARAHRRQMSMIEGRCSSFEVNTPYYLWNTFLKSLLRVEPDTPEPELRSRLHEMVKALALEPDEPYLASLLSLRSQEILLEEDEERKSKMYSSARRLLKAYAERKRVVYVFEDLHWIDRFSQALLEFLMKEERLAPALIVCLFRPEYRKLKVLVGTGKLLDLDRLSGTQARELMCLRFNVESMPDQLAGLIEQRSEGNPFFIEEIIKTLLDRGIVSVKKGKLEVQAEKLESGVPETLQGVILARIDQLEGRIREVLLDASVIGREFSRPVLELVVQKKIDVGAGLKKLESLELVFEKEEARELEYLFKHYLIQEVAYNTLLQKKRKQLHGTIARAIEKLYAEKLKDFYELLAFHYEKAEEWEKAASFLSMSGRKVEEIFTKEESKEFVERKEAALEQLFASKAEKSTWYFKVLAVVTLVLMIALALFMTTSGSYLMLRSIGIKIGIMDTLTRPDRPNMVGIGLLVLAEGLVFLYLALMVLKTGSALGRIRVYEVLDDGVSLLFKGGKRFVIPFSEVQSLTFVPKNPEQRGLWGRLSERISGGGAVVGLSHQPIKGPPRLTMQYAPLFNTPAKEGFVHIRRKKGVSIFRAQMKIGSDRMKILQEVRNLGLTPSHTAEFYEQLNVAFLKWQSKHCVHCASPVQSSGLCSSCGYARQLQKGTVGSEEEGSMSIRPVRNTIVEFLEFLMTVNSLAGIGFIAFSLAFAVKVSPALVFFILFGSIQFIFPAAIWFFKRKTEKRLTVEITRGSVAYGGDLPFRQGLMVPFQDILSIKSYANQWQRLFGLANVEIETRNSLPFVAGASIFAFFIPSIRNAEYVVQLLRERSKFLKH